MAAGALLYGCSTSDTHPPGIGDCVGPGCGDPSGPGNTPGKDAAPDTSVSDASSDADAAEAAATTSLSGTVVLLSDARFQTPTEYFGAATVRVPTPSGDASYPANGDGGQGFSAENVVAAPGWFSVFPSADAVDAGSGAYVTWSYLPVPVSGSTAFQVPLLDRINLLQILSTIQEPTFPRVDSAQVVVVFERNGQRVPNVSLTKVPTCETVLYDLGVGYSNAVTATGTAGVVYLVNAVGTGKIEWKELGAGTGAVTPTFVPAQATFMRIELP